MTTTDRINILNALEETKQDLPEQLYKTAIESLAKFVPEEEKDVEVLKQENIEAVKGSDSNYLDVLNTYLPRCHRC